MATTAHYLAFFAVFSSDVKCIRVNQQMLRHHIKGPLSETRFVVVTSKMCRIIFFSIHLRCPVSNHVSRFIHISSLIQEKIKQQSCPSSGDEHQEGEAGEEERGRERDNRSCSTVIGVLLGMVCVAGLRASANLLGPHPVTLH